MRGDQKVKIWHIREELEEMHEPYGHPREIRMALIELITVLLDDEEAQYARKSRSKHGGDSRCQTKSTSQSKTS